MGYQFEKFGIKFVIPNPSDKHSKLGIMPRTFLMGGKEVSLVGNSQLTTRFFIEEAENKESLLKLLEGKE